MRSLLRTLLLAAGLLACTPEPGRTPLDLNAATEKQMEELPGIGPVHARSIMASRNARGGHFGKLDDLLDIKGIGKETVEKIRPYVVLGPGK